MNRLKTFLDEYKENIEPQINAIDIFIKSHTSPLNIKGAADILCISYEEIESIMACENINAINKHNFFKIMQKGSSAICRLFKRQLERGFMGRYTPEDISYIYNIDITCVLDASKKIGISQFDDILLKVLFENIQL